ncbi:MAG: AAA family ATPase [Actinomycetota bacterium]|nr:AAA family ATPase [Actinomycetota bacterium]
MQAVILCGVQGSGKTSFYLGRFFATHVRISLDMLRTRRRERLLLDACLAAQQPFVVDNTNPTRREREPYLRAAADARFRALGYYFDATRSEAIARNQARPKRERIPVAGILGTFKRLERPRLDEGFDALYRVTIDPDRGFAVAPLDEPPEP